MRDGAEIFDQLVVRHANAKVFDRNRASFLVRRNLNLKIEVCVEDILFSDLRMAQFLGGIRCVGN